jgi:redox-sensitive bicupin YhaK (pirin superfamily)
VRLSKRDRSAPPRFERILRASLPVVRGRGAEIRVYSGTSGAARSPTLNYVPVTLVDIVLQPGASIDQEIPASYNGFLYVLEGEVRVGDARMTEAQVGWLDRPTVQGASVLRLSAGANGGRAVLYAGEPQNEPTVQRGPFVAGSDADIARLHREFRAGTFERMSNLRPVVHATAAADAVRRT